MARSLRRRSNAHKWTNPTFLHDFILSLFRHLQMRPSHDKIPMLSLNWYTDVISIFLLSEIGYHRGTGTGYECCLQKLTMDIYMKPGLSSVAGPPRRADGLPYCRHCPANAQIHRHSHMITNMRTHLGIFNPDKTRQRWNTHTLNPDKRVFKRTHTKKNCKLQTLASLPTVMAEEGRKPAGKQLKHSQALCRKDYRS